MALASVSPTVAGSKPKKLLDQTRDVLRLKPGRQKILRVVKRSASRKARSVPLFDAQRNPVNHELTRMNTNHQMIFLRPGSTGRWPVGAGCQPARTF